MMWSVLLGVFLCASLGSTEAQIAYRGHLSELRIQELINMAKELENSINPEKYACDNYFDYVCSRNRPLFSIMGKKRLWFDHCEDCLMFAYLCRSQSTNEGSYRASNSTGEWYGKIWGKAKANWFFHFVQQIEISAGLLSRDLWVFQARVWLYYNTDNQLFVVTCAPARNNMSGYVAYGHSMIIDPWARVQREAGDGLELIVEEIGKFIKLELTLRSCLFNCPTLC